MVVRNFLKNSKSININRGGILNKSFKKRNEIIKNKFRKQQKCFSR